MNETKTRIVEQSVTFEGVFGEVCRQRRKDMKLTQWELAAQCGLGQPTISRIETGGGDAHLSTLRTLARGLGLSLSALVDLAEARWNRL